MVRAGIPESVALKMSGHKTRLVFECHNITSSGDLREAARKLDAATGRDAAAVQVLLFVPLLHHSWQFARTWAALTRAIAGNQPFAAGSILAFKRNMFPGSYFALTDPSRA